MDADFRLFKLSLTSRLILAASMYAGGLVLGLLAPVMVLPGVFLAALGWFPLFLKSLSNKPDDQGLESWRPVTIVEVDKLDDAIRETGKLKRKSGQAGTVVLAFFLLIPIFLIAAGSSVAGRFDVALIFGLFFVCLVPGLVFGRLKLHAPAEIAFKLPSFKALLKETDSGTTVVVPSIRYDKDSKGADVPEDIRMTFESKHPLSDFIGIQIQCTKNKGPNGEVPYLYAVVLTRGITGPAYRSASGLSLPGYEIEPGGDSTFGTVVVRQSTTGKGYHTREDDCGRLGRVCSVLVRELSVH